MDRGERTTCYRENALTRKRVIFENVYWCQNTLTQDDP